MLDSASSLIITFLLKCGLSSLNMVPFLSQLDLRQIEMHHFFFLSLLRCLKKYNFYQCCLMGMFRLSIIETSVYLPLNHTLQIQLTMKNYRHTLIFLHFFKIINTLLNHTASYYELMSALFKGHITTDRNYGNINYGQFVSFS